MKLVLGTAVLLLLALGAAAQPPTADPTQTTEEEAFCIIQIMPNKDFTRVFWEQDLEINESARQSFLDDIDTGDNDHISLAEVAAYEANNQWEESVELGERAMKINDKRPQNVVWHIELVGFVGPTEWSDGHKVIEKRTYSFAKQGADTFRIEGGRDVERDYQVAIEFVIITAPDGFKISNVNGEQMSEKTASFSGFDTRGYYSLTFKESKLGEEGNGIGLMLTAVTLVGLAFAVRRQRQ